MEQQQKVEVAQPVEQLVDLATIGNGAPAEMFTAELKGVLQNIKDPNTDWKGKRKITIEFVFQPAEDREMIFVGIAASSRLAKTKPAGDVMYVGKHEGELVGTVMHRPDGQPQDPRQATLQFPNKKGA